MYVIVSHTDSSHFVEEIHNRDKEILFQATWLRVLLRTASLVSRNHTWFRVRNETKKKPGLRIHAKEDGFDVGKAAGAEHTVGGVFWGY